MLSIIIPTLNEEKHIENLLASIKKQDFYDYEVIVADAGSKDGTKEIAKKYNCRIIKGGLPAKGRNQGAKIAKGDIFLFVDGDTVLPDGFIKKNIEEINKRKLDVAGARIASFEKNRIADILFDFFYNIPAILTEKILPHAAIGIFIKRDVFEKLSGFNEEITIAEDHYLARRAKKISKFGVLRSIKIQTSLRRFREDGWFKTYLKYLFVELHMIFIGPVRSKIVDYQFDHYSQKKEKDVK